MQKIKRTLKKHPYRYGFIIFALTVLSLSIFRYDTTEQDDSSNVTARKTVSTITVSDFSSGASGVYVPSAAGNAFVVRSESGGMVENVANTETTIEAGAVLVKLENSAQAAALTQAQGSYEAALAGAEQTQFNVDTTNENLDKVYAAAKTSLRSTLIDVQNIMKDTVEDFFNPTNIYRFELTQENWNKKLIGYDLSDWADNINTNQTNSSLVADIDFAINVTDRAYNLVNIIYNEVLDEENGADETYQQTLTTYRGTLIAARGKLSNTLNSLESAKLSILSAESSLKRAEQSSTGGYASAADAQVKQALGSLQAAKAAYEKTIIRAPFAGTIVAINVNAGDIINTGADIAIIKPNNITDAERSFVLPLTSVKYTPTGAYVLSPLSDGSLESIPVETGLITTSHVNITGLEGDEVIVSDVRGLKAGEVVNLN